jgi:hypothetical protein
MCILKEKADLTQRDLADNLGVNVGWLNYSPQALDGEGPCEDAGLRLIENKIGYVFELTPRDMAEKPNSPLQQ